MALTTDKKKFTFTDQEGEIVASCTLHSADIGTYQRCMTVMEWFQSNPAEGAETLEQYAAFNETVEAKVCYILGYDARPELFGRIAATAILPVGRPFVCVVLDAIAGELNRAEQERRDKRMEAVKRHTAKYQ